MVRAGLSPEVSFGWTKEEAQEGEPSSRGELTTWRWSEFTLLHCLKKLSPWIYMGFFVAIIKHSQGVYCAMILPYCVYVLQSQRDLLLYHGFTTNLRKRIMDHNGGKTNSTSKRRPLKLIYCEFFINKSDAARREKYFKTSQGKRMLKLLLRKTLSDIKYPNCS